MIKNKIGEKRKCIKKIVKNAEKSFRRKSKINVFVLNAERQIIATISKNIMRNT